jgi:hypothetical protein
VVWRDVLIKAIGPSGIPQDCFKVAGISNDSQRRVTAILAKVDFLDQIVAPCFFSTLDTAALSFNPVALIRPVVTELSA